MSQPTSINSKPIENEGRIQNTLPGLSNLAYHPPTTNGLVTRMFTSKTMGAGLDLKEMVLTLNEQVEQLRKGDKTQVDSILYSQAVTLNAIFTEMARRAALNMGKHLDATEAYTRMALRAQNQARATLETLVTIRNPSVIIAKQANITSGSQQVNNVLSNSETSQDLIQPNQLSGGSHKLRQNS